MIEENSYHTDNNKEIDQNIDTNQPSVLPVITQRKNTQVGF